MKTIKPLHSDPIKVMGFGLVVILAGILLESLLPKTDHAMESEYLKASGTGILYLCGGILFLFPILKRVWIFWQNRRK